MLAAKAFEPPLLEDTEQFGLGDERHVANLVEEECPVVGEFKATGLAIVRAGERTFLVAEDFRFEQRVWQRRTIDRLEIPGTAPAQLVNHPRHDFLAGAGGSENQHRDVRLCGRADPLEHDQHLLVAADHLAEPLHGGRLVLHADVRTALEEMIQEIPDRGRTGRSRVPGRIARHQPREAEVDEFAHAILDIQAQAPERLHQRLDVERLALPRVQVAQDAGPERRLHEGAKPCIEVGGSSRFRNRRSRTRAPRAKGKIIHAWRLGYRPDVDDPTGGR